MTGSIINGVKVPFVPLGGPEGIKKSPVELPDERSFDVVFQKELREIKFSKHAQERLETRNIQLDENDLSQIGRAVDKAEAKGANDSLVLLRDMAFIVSIKNRVVVTAIDNEAMHENVFTNIDSAVIAS